MTDSRGTDRVSDETKTADHLQTLFPDDALEKDIDEEIIKASLSKDFGPFVKFLHAENEFRRIKILSRAVIPDIPEEFYDSEGFRSLDTRIQVFLLFGSWDLITKSCKERVMFSSAWFWKLCRDGISQCYDSVFFKYSFYLLKTSIHHTIDPIAHWVDYFVLFETLNEKQLHLIKPVLGALPSLRIAFENDLSWYFLIYRRLFKHQNFAVVCWSVDHFMKEFSFDELREGSSIKEDFLRALNITKLYRRDKPIREGLNRFFRKGSVSLDVIIKSIIEVFFRWGPTPLFFIVEALVSAYVQQNRNNVLSQKTLSDLGNFVGEKLVNYESDIKFAIHTRILSLIFSSSTVDASVFSVIQGCLKHFTKKSVLVPGSKLWRTAKEWLSLLTCENVLPADSSPNERALFALFLEDPEEYMKQQIYLPLMESERRPYAPINNYFETLLEYICLENKRVSFINEEYFYNLLKKRFDKLIDPEDLKDKFDLLFNAFVNISKHHKQFQDQFLKSISFDYLKHEDEMKKFILIGIMAEAPAMLVEELMSDWLEQKFPDRLLLNKTDGSVVKKGGLLECLYLQNQWRLLLTHTKAKITDDRLLEAASTSIEVGGSHVLIPIAKFLKKTLNRNSNRAIEKIYKDILTRLEDSIFYYQKNSIFKPALKALFELAFHPDIILNFPNETSDFALRILKKSETVSTISDILVDILNSMPLQSPIEWSEFLSEGAMYGPIFRKDYALSEEVQNLALEIIERPKALYSIRLTALQLASKMTDPTLVIKNLLDNITGETCNNRLRHFENSIIHLRRNRACQGILILMRNPTHASKDFFSRILKELLNEDKTRQQQASVRYLLEWILARMILFDSDLLALLFESYEIARIKRLSVIPTFIVVFTQVALKRVDFREKAIDILTPWLMGQHFSTRIAAQICVRRLLLESSKWGFVGELLDEVLNQGDVAKNKANLQKDFYLNSLDVENNYNTRDILLEFPRLCSISREDWILDPPTIGDVPHNQKNSMWSFHEEITSICFCATCVPESEKQFELQTEEETFKDIQKKIVIESEEEFSSKTPAFPNLILVASLIDRPPNLGGLCRTSEILGVGSLVLNCLKTKEDKEFLNLSVSSHNWVNTIEVREEALPTYLKNKREVDGFTIVGIEQTLQSKCLYDYSFPDKSVLVLGNEKEGIPPEILREVDVTVEIPQTGVTRSFNVHVTGALVVSEYARQRRKK